jgi:hypothetical protein
MLSTGKTRRGSSQEHLAEIQLSALSQKPLRERETVGARDVRTQSSSQVISTQQSNWTACFEKQLCTSVATSSRKHHTVKTIAHTSR